LRACASATATSGYFARIINHNRSIEDFGRAMLLWPPMSEVCRNMAVIPYKNHQMIIAKYDIIRQIEGDMATKEGSQSDISPPRSKTLIENSAWKELICLV
jgi:hypothetical protein